ncbi:hypothetical protein C2E23DRAFT_764843 [Lenzites betulinus]|nr:hypothetical protein C2E23DRAFT_764843 [Lenzites betulinus]
MAVYKQMKVRLPLVSQVSPLRPVDIIHACPARNLPLGVVVPSKLSTVLAQDPGQPAGFAFDKANPLKGLRVARVRVIFQLPFSYNMARLNITEPLAYLEWFTPFRTVDSATGMYIVSASTRQHRRFCSVIPISLISRSCHLIPRWGKHAEHHVLAAGDDVLDDPALKFFVNPYLRHHDFVLFRLLDGK